jgi:predicted RNase H-like nuclease
LAAALSLFVGVDLGWYGKPSGLAVLTGKGSKLRVRAVTRLQGVPETIQWIRSQTGNNDAVVAVDAPLVIPIQTGIRLAERQLNQQFRRYHAGCYPANLGRPFAPYVLAFSRALEAEGFQHGAEMSPHQPGRFQIEVHPHAATISLFDLPRIIKYKRGRRVERAKELGRLRDLLRSRLPRLRPSLHLSELVQIPEAGPLKPVEDQLDAVFCAYIAAYWWFWGRERNWVFGTPAGGYIVVPHPANAARQQSA